MEGNNQAGSNIDAAEKEKVSIITTYDEMQKLLHRAEKEVIKGTEIEIAIDAIKRMKEKEIPIFRVNIEAEIEKIRKEIYENIKKEKGYVDMLVEIEVDSKCKQAKEILLGLENLFKEFEYEKYLKALNMLYVLTEEDIKR